MASLAYSMALCLFSVAGVLGLCSRHLHGKQAEGLLAIAILLCVCAVIFFCNGVAARVAEDEERDREK